MTERRFDITEDHLKLLRKTIVVWNGDEWGAPSIDPKRPYGNGDIFRDIADLLGEETVEVDGEDLVPDDLRRRLAAIHRETATALEICLRTGSFEAGTYICRGYGRDWIRES